MNAVSSHLEKTAFLPVMASALSELDAFVNLDPLLADLNKQYRDARANCAQAEAEFGADDPMAEMALLVQDSAWCAMQTRYMELRAEREMMARAQELMEEARLEEESRARKNRERDALDKFRNWETVLRLQKEGREKSNGADIWLAAMFLWLSEKQMFRFYHPTYSFNRLAAA